MAKHHRPPVQKYHDRVAGCYDASYEDAYWRWHNMLTWDYLKPFLPHDLRAAVLDLGCGTGTWGAKLVRSGYTVIFVDISAAMLDQARRKIEEQGGLARASFVQADLCDLSALPAHSASLAVAFGDPIGCTSSPVLALKQIRRGLTDDGVLVATFDNRLAAIDHYMTLGDAAALARFLRDGATHWLTKNPQERFPIHTFGPGELRALVARAGFEVIEMIGKTVLPLRQHRELLVDAAARRAWGKIEKTLCRDPFAMGRASHLQIACRMTAADRGSGPPP